MDFCNTYSTRHRYKSPIVTILILIDGFLQLQRKTNTKNGRIVTILILVDGFLQYMSNKLSRVKSAVTILILVDGFLQYKQMPELFATFNASQSLF